LKIRWSNKAFKYCPLCEDAEALLDEMKGHFDFEIWIDLDDGSGRRRHAEILGSAMGTG
jgi:hypothetical protein